MTIRQYQKQTWTRRELLAAAAAATAAAKAAPSAATLPPEVRVAIIGLEGHTSEVTDAAKALPSVKIVAIADRSEALVRRAASNPALRGARTYSDPRALLDREKLELVAVCGDNASRAAIVRDCAARKLPVVAEKPLALTLEDLAATRRAVTAGGARLTMLLPMRFSPVYQALRRIVADGRIGDVVALGAQKSYKLGARPDWMKKRATFGGTIPYIGIHMVDLMRWTSGREMVEAAAFQSTVGFPEIGEMENNTATIFRLDNRGTASLRMDYLRPETAPSHGDDRLRIAGTRGVVEYQESTGVTLMTSADKPGRVTELPPRRELVVDFIESLYGGAPHWISPSDVFRVTEIVLRAREAAETGRVVRL